MLCSLYTCSCLGVPRRVSNSRLTKVFVRVYYRFDFLDRLSAETRGSAIAE